MDIGGVSGSNQTRHAATARSASIARTVASPFEQVSLSAASVPLPDAPTAGSSAAASQRQSVMRGVGMAFMLTATLLGAAGCASMVGNGPNSAYMLAQNVTGHEAKDGYASFAFLDKVATPQGGGLFKDGSATQDNRLAPLDALDRMLDHQKVFYVNKADGKPQQVHSWAELKGIEQMTRDGLTTATVPH